MLKKSRAIGASSIGIIDVIANGAAALLLLIVVSLGSQGEKELGSNRNEDDPIVLARQINPHIKLNNLPVQGPLLLLPYDEVDKLHDTLANFHSIEVHESRIVLRDADAKGPVVIGRAELLQENNRFDAYLRRQSKDVLKQIRLELYELGLYHIVASIMIDNNANPGRFRFSLKEENRSAPMDQLVILRLSLEDERLMPAQIEEFRKRLARIEAAFAQAREGGTATQAEEAMERLRQELERALVASRNARPSVEERVHAGAESAGLSGAEAESKQTASSREMREQGTAVGGADGVDDATEADRGGSFRGNEVSAAPAEPPSTQGQLRTPTIPKAAMEAAEQQIENLLQSARVAEPNRSVAQSEAASGWSNNPDAIAPQFRGDGNDDQNRGIPFLAGNEQDERNSTSLVFDVWQRSENQPSPAQRKDRLSEDNELRSLVLRFADPRSRPDDDHQGLVRQSQIGVFVTTKDGKARRELGTARVNSGDVGMAIEVFKREIRREIFKDEFQTILVDKRRWRNDGRTDDGRGPAPSASDYLSNQDLKVFAEAVRELAITVKEEIVRKQDHADADRETPGADTAESAKDIKSAAQAIDDRPLEGDH